jgi:hypothetical protein
VNVPSSVNSMKITYDEYGCINFRPQLVIGIDNDTPKIILLSEFCKKNKNYVLLKENMDLTYPLQRLDIINYIEREKGYNDFLDVWPVFEDHQLLNLHFQTLMGFSAKVSFEAHFEQVASFVVQYLGTHW